MRKKLLWFTTKNMKRGPKWFRKLNQHATNKQLSQIYDTWVRLTTQLQVAKNAIDKKRTHSINPKEHEEQMQSERVQVSHRLQKRIDDKKRIGQTSIELAINELLPQIKQMKQESIKVEQQISLMRQMSQ